MSLVELIVNKASFDSIKDFLKAAGRGKIARAMGDAAYYRRWDIVRYLCGLQQPLNQPEFWSIVSAAYEASGLIQSTFNAAVIRQYYVASFNFSSVHLEEVAKAGTDPNPNWDVVAELIDMLIRLARENARTLMVQLECTPGDVYDNFPAIRRLFTSLVKQNKTDLFNKMIGTLVDPSLLQKVINDEILQAATFGAVESLQWLLALSDFYQDNNNLEQLFSHTCTCHLSPEAFRSMWYLHLQLVSPDRIIQSSDIPDLASCRDLVLNSPACRERFSFMRHHGVLVNLASRVQNTESRIAILENPFFYSAQPQQSYPFLGERPILLALKIIADRNTEKQFDDKLQQLEKDIGALIGRIHYFPLQIEITERVCKEIEKLTSIGGGLGWGPLNDSLKALIAAIRKGEPIKTADILKFFTPVKDDKKLQSEEKYRVVGEPVLGIVIPDEKSKRVVVVGNAPAASSGSAVVDAGFFNLMSSVRVPQHALPAQSSVSATYAGADVEQEEKSCCTASF